MKSIARFREELAKKVGTLLKGGGSKELPSLFSTSPSARDLEEQEIQEQNRRKYHPNQARNANSPSTTTYQRRNHS